MTSAVLWRLVGFLAFVASTFAWEQPYDFFDLYKGASQWNSKDGKEDMDMGQHMSSDESATCGMKCALGSENCPQPCLPCQPNQCKLPNCKCSNFTIPGKIPKMSTPQIVVFTIQNAVTKGTYEKFQELFQGLRNPNNCPATGTYFVSHTYTDHFLVQSLRSQGHEIGSNTVTATLNTTDYWKNADCLVWWQQIQDQRTILKTFANITDATGFRAPYLQPGGDNQMWAMKLLGLYDSTLVSINYSRSSDQLLWPYTFDFKSTQDCVVPPCPKKCYKGIWEFPLLAFQDGFGHSCASLDACNTTTYNDVFRLLYDRLDSHYANNRAPLLITVDAAFLLTEFKFKGLRLFLEYITSYKEVFVVSAGRALEWARNPTPLSQINLFKPWNCDRPNPPVCEEASAIVCRYGANRKPSATSIYTLRTCNTKTGCPKCYPWLSDPLGVKC